MNRSIWIAGACAAGLVSASLAAFAKPPPEWPGTYVYYDQAGTVVGEANNALCLPQASWGVVTRNFDYRLGCGFSQ